MGFLAPVAGVVSAVANVGGRLLRSRTASQAVRAAGQIGRAHV